MKTMKWLIRRELWEHKGMLFWAPAALACVIAALTVTALAWGHKLMMSGGAEISINEVTITPGGLVRMGDALSLNYLGMSAPLFVLMSFLVFFYCLAALHDERRDRSLLFWKSLPVSDTMTVLSKAALALLVAPLITIALGAVLGLLVMLMVCTVLSMHGVNLFFVFGRGEFYLTPLRMVALLPVYAVWALPTVGWLLLVSSWARSKVILWAVGLPLMTGLLIMWATRIFALDWDGSWFMHQVVVGILLGTVPGLWLLHMEPAVVLITAATAHQITPSSIFAWSWNTLANADAWIGAAAGVAMIAAATWMRRRREEG